MTNPTRADERHAQVKAMNERDRLDGLKARLRAHAARLHEYFYVSQSGAEHVRRDLITAADTIEDLAARIAAVEKLAKRLERLAATYKARPKLAAATTVSREIEVIADEIRNALKESE